MTSWGLVILVAAVIVGLRGKLTQRPAYFPLIAVMIFALSYAALKQHTY